MTEHNSYWMRYHDGKQFKHVAVVAADLDEAFRMVKEMYDVDNSEVTFRNRELNVLLPF